MLDLAQVQFDAVPERTEVAPGLVAVAMSGGVDSSTVAAVLQQQGQPIIGLTMQLWNQRRLPELQGDAPAQHRCCSLDDVYDAKRVARHWHRDAQLLERALQPVHVAALVDEAPCPHLAHLVDAIGELVAAVLDVHARIAMRYVASIHIGDA